MAANVFVSYDHDDYSKKNGFLALKNNPNHPLDFHDHSLKDPVRDARGNVIRYSPNDERSKPVRDEIIKKFERASRLIVLIGNDTWKSDWVDWEVKTFHSMKEKIDEGVAYKRIRGMFLKDRSGSKIPESLNRRSVNALLS